MRILDFSDGFESGVQPEIVIVAATGISVTPTGTISATNVQAALEELDSEKVPRISSIDNRMTRFDGTAGAIQSTGITVDDSNNLSGLGTLAGAFLKDEDDMSSDSATHVPSQQSVKAYVDAQSLPPIPTVQVFASGVAQTYTTPANCRLIKVRMVGGGGSGGGGGASATNGSAGNATTFSTLSAGGGGAGTVAGNNPGAGGSSTGSLGTTIALSGGSGSGSSSHGATMDVRLAGGVGGSTAFGGGGRGQYNLAGGNGAPNTGAGGGGGGTEASGATQPGSGGGSGGYIEAYISSPAATYTYTVGAAQTSVGAAGTSGFAGGQGAAGLIIVEEFY